MPLSEFLRLAIEKLESSKQKSRSTDVSSRTESNLVKVVWESGPTNHSFSPNTPSVCDSATVNIGGVDSIFTDISPAVPSRPLNLSCPIDDALQDYGSKRIPEDSYVLSAPTMVNSGQLCVKECKESFLVKGTKNFFQDTCMETDKALARRSTDNSTIVIGGDTDTSIEPMVAYGVSYEQKRKLCDIEPECHNDDDVQHESVGVKKQTHVRGCTGLKRSRTTEVHNLSERRRRDRINEKMRALQELIPNCNKTDKASMLDEAIQYLKNLQHQVHIMSMGGGFCYPPMMYPAPLPHFPPMDIGTGTSMGFGNIYGGSPPRPIFPVPSFQGAHFPCLSLGHLNFQGIPGPYLPTHGQSWPGLDSRVPRPPLITSPLTQNKMPSKPSNLNFEDPMS